jgi:hypothetical protein
MLYQLSRHFYGRLGWIPCLLLLTCLPSLRHSIQLQQSKCIDSLLFSSKKMTKPRGMPLGLISSTLFLLGFQVRVLFTQHLYPDINVTGSLMYTNSREAHEFLGIYRSPPGYFLFLWQCQALRRCYLLYMSVKTGSGREEVTDGCLSCFLFRRCGHRCVRGNC